MPLSTREYRAVLDMLDIIYDVPDKCAMFAAVSLELQKLTGIYSSVFAATDSKTRQYIPGDGVTFGIPVDCLQTYLGHYVKLDPFIYSGWYTGDGQNNVTRNTDIVPRQQLLNSEFGHDFLLDKVGIFYSFATALVAQGDMVGTCGFHRQFQQGDFSEHDREIVNLLLPHIARAMRNLELWRETDISSNTRAIIMLDENGKAFYTSPEAARILKKKQFDRLIDPGLGIRPAYARSGGRCYRIRTLPLGRRANGKIVMLDPHPSEHQIRPNVEGFKLSARETEVALLVIQGLTNREVGERLGITEQTVKDHLHSVFEKIGIRRRTELAAIMWGNKRWPR